MEKIVRQVVFANPPQKRRKRVAAYARVSAAKDAAEHSLEAQEDYYKTYINKVKDWEFAGVYADYAVTGTKPVREGFQRMLDDCRAGKIDMIVTKAISRFARNTVTLLETVRELKLLGIDVFFEEQNLHSISYEGEMIITLVASIAQEESRSVSENMLWRINKNFEEGKPWHVTEYGYRYDGEKFVVFEDEAKYVRYAFKEYLSGKGYYAIARELTKKTGVKWLRTRVSRMLNNYIYTGNIILQTTYTQDHISKKRCVNNGEKPMYLAKESHEAIVSMEDFLEVRRMMDERSVKFCRPDVKDGYDLKGRIFCAECGRRMTRLERHDIVIWRCCGYHREPNPCSMKPVQEHRLCDALGTVVRSVDEIERIDIRANDTLLVRTFSGKELPAEMKPVSRRESWTDEMKQTAREKEFERQRRQKEQND
ncbi:MAG: recombinase family protein [Clostridia bacterium]|nr:recombinase family protein [Clostridia bacterium]